MKKFLSYILTFITMFAISAVVTIRLKSDLLETSQPTISAGASGQTSLLAGIMESIETNPKLDINGNINTEVSGNQIDVQLNAQIDLTTLTNPSVMGSVDLTYDNNNYSILFTYTQNQIFLSHNNISVQAPIEDITQMAGILSSVVGTNISLPNIQLPQINLDAIMASLSNPVKTEVGDLTYYQITLPDIAKVTLICDNNFNIQNVSIDELYLIQDAQVQCSLNINQDSNINVTAPSNNSSYLNVAHLIENFLQLQHKQVLTVDSWTSIYKNKKQFERLDTYGILSIPNNKYEVYNKIKGLLTGDLNFKYLNDTLYANFNDIGLSATGEQIGKLLDLFKDEEFSADQSMAVQTSGLINDFLTWLTNNYQSVLDSAVISSNQIVLKADLNGLLGQTKPIQITLGLKNDQINSIRISNLTLGEYVIHTAMYIDQWQEYNFSVDYNKYYTLDKVLSIVDWASNLQTLDVVANMQLSQNSNDYNFNVAGKFDLQNNAQQLSTSIYGLPINIAQQNGTTYLNINDIYVSTNNQTIGALLSQFMPQQEVDDLIVKISTIAKNLTINEILSLVNISTTQNTINISADLSQFVGKPLLADLTIEYNNGIQIIINNVKYSDFAISGTINIQNVAEVVTVQSPEEYLAVESFAKYVNEFITSQNLSLQGEIDFSQINGINQKFVGAVSVNFADTSFSLIGKLTGKLNANVELMYLDNVAYITYNKQYFAISKSKLQQLLLQFGIDISPIFEELENKLEAKNNLNIKTLLAGLFTSIKTNNNVEQNIVTNTLVEQAIDIIQSIKIDSSTIELNNKIGNLDLFASVALNKNMGVAINACFNNYTLMADLVVSTQAVNYQVAEGYINLDLIVPKVVAILNTAKCNNFEGIITVKWGTGALDSIKISYQLFVDVENMQFAVSLNTTYNNLYIAVQIVDGQIYLQVEDVYLNVTLEQLIGFVTKLFDKQINQALTKIDEVQNLSTDQILELIYNTTSYEPLIKSLNNNGLATYITLCNGLKIVLSGKDTLSSVQIKYNNYSIHTKIKATTGLNKVTVQEPQQYLNIVDFVEYAETFVTSNNLLISGEIDFSQTNSINQKFVGDISLNFTNTNLMVSGKLIGKINADIELIFVNNIVYVTYNKQYFKISKTQLVKLAGEFGINIEPIFEQLTNIVLAKNNFSLKQCINNLITKLTQTTNGLNTTTSTPNYEEVDFDSIVKLIKSVKVHSCSIAFNTNVLEAQVNTSLLLNNMLGVNASVSIGDICVKTNLNISTTEQNYNPNKQYIDLGLLTNYVSASKNTIECNSFSGIINAQWGTQENQSIQIEYLININKQTMGLELALYTTYLGLPINLYFVNDSLYLQVQNIYVRATTQQIAWLANTVFGDQLAEAQQAIEQLKNISAEQLLHNIYNITTKQTLITNLWQNNQVLWATLFNNITIGLGATNTINYIAFSYNNINVNATINAVAQANTIDVVNANNYLNIEELINYAEGFVTSTDLALEGEIELENAGIYEKFVGCINVNFANTNLKVSGKLIGKINADIELIYVNNSAYLTFNKQQFVLSKQELINILAEFKIDIVPILDKVEEVIKAKNSFSLKQYLSNLLTNCSSIVNNTNSNFSDNSCGINNVINVINNAYLNKTNAGLYYTFGDTQVNVGLALNNSLQVVANIDKSALKANANLIISTKSTEYVVNKDYINLNNIHTTINGIVNTIKDTQYNGELNVCWGADETQSISGTYNISIIDNKIYGTITATYLEQTVTIYVMHNMLYLNIKGVYVKASVEQIKQILKVELPQQTQQQITDFANKLNNTTTQDIITKFEELTNQVLIENCLLADNQLNITVKGFTAKISTLNNKLSKVEVGYNGINISATINSSTNATKQILDTTSYVDVDNVYNLVKNVYNYVIGGNYYFNINASAFGYNVTGYIGYNTALEACLTTTIANKALTVTILNNTIYINFDGFNASMAFADIPAFITELNTQFNLNISESVLNVIDALFNTNSTNSINTAVENLLGNNKPSIKEVLNTIQASLTNSNITITYNNLFAIISYANNMLTGANIDYNCGNNQSISANITLCDKQQITVNTACLNLSSATALIENIAQLVNNTNYAGNFTFIYTDIELLGQFKLAILNGELSAQISTTFYNLPIEVTIVNNTVYLAIDNIKMYVPLTQISTLIGWINSSFNTNIQSNINISTKLSDMSGDISLEGFNLGDLVVNIINNVVSITKEDLVISASLGDVNNLTLTYGSNINLQLSLQTANNIISVTQDDYLHYTELTSLVDSLVDLYNGKKLSATAMGYVYEGITLHYTATCQIQIDLALLEFYANISVLDHFEEKTTNFMLAYYNNYWYVDYNNLKLKIVKTDLAEIMVILLELVGIDSSLLPFLEGVAGGLSVDVNSLKSIVPKLDFGNPMSLIDVFEQLKLQQNSFSVVIDNTLISDKLNVDNMSAELKTSQGKLSYIALNKLYTGTTDYEYLNFTLTPQEFTGVNKPEGTYIDISGANELIKAVINTAELNYFEIQGTIKLDMIITILGLDVDIDWDIPINVKIRLDDNRKPEILISLGSIPAMLGVNNDVPYVYGDTESSDSRMWYIYYKDSYVYMLREDKLDWYRITSWGSRIYQKKLKTHVESLFSDFFYYLQWGIGFTDDIMGAIKDALALSDNHDPDLGKIINSFTCSDSSNFIVDVNLQEISNNPQVKNMVINLGVVNNQTTNNKNYVGKAELYLYMPIEPGTFEINLTSTDLTLVNIGKPFDFTNFENFVYNYSGNEGVEYDRTWDIGKAETSWVVATERTYTITFEEQGGQTVSDISGKAGQAITLPTLSNKVEVDSDAGKRYTYSFGGWYNTVV